jgi:hypothetical protein
VRNVVIARDVEALEIGRGLDFGMIVDRFVAFARNEGPSAGMRGEPRARPSGRVLGGMEVLDQLKRTAAVLTRATGEVVELLVLTCAAIPRHF